MPGERTASGLQLPPDEALHLARGLKARAYALGFDLAGIARLGPAESARVYDEWLARGMHGAMGYLSRGAEKRRDTRLPFPGAVSALVVAMEYGGREPAGPVARYARGDDYHEIMVERLRELQAWLGNRLGEPVAGKAYADTGPILERELAQKAGLGWFGKNTCLINPSVGSFTFLGSLLVALELPPDEPFQADRCGTCTRCLEACPTGAIAGPRELDATRCIAYLTIELKGAIPERMRELIGDKVYGCDICQDVCPFNHKFSRELSEPSFASRPVLSGRDARSLALELLSMSQSEFSSAFRRSPMKRPKLRGLKRNSAVVLGNVGSAEDVSALAAALADSDPVVREHASWALGRIGSPEALEALRLATRCEAVREEEESPPPTFDFGA